MANDPKEDICSICGTRVGYGDPSLHLRDCGQHGDIEERVDALEGDTERHQHELESLRSRIQDLEYQVRDKVDEWKMRELENRVEELRAR